MAYARKHKHQQGASTAPTGKDEGGDVKIDVEVDGDKNAKKHSDTSSQEETAGSGHDSQTDTSAQDTQACEAEIIDEDDEQARVEAAIKAGEAAADEDFKSKVDDLQAERDELAHKLANVSDEIESAKSEAATSAERLSRLQADWDNYRRRTDRERAVERERASEGLVKDLLPAIDDLERAVTHASDAAHDDAVVQQLVDGVSAVHAKIISVLEKQGVEVIDPSGEAFNPDDHQAVGRVENSDVYDETVADVYQKGYRLAGKIVRPAMVTVAYGGAKRPDESDDAPSDARADAH